MHILPGAGDRAPPPPFRRNECEPSSLTHSVLKPPGRLQRSAACPCLNHLVFSVLQRGAALTCSWSREPGSRRQREGGGPADRPPAPGARCRRPPACTHKRTPQQCDIIAARCRRSPVQHPRGWLQRGACRSGTSGQHCSKHKRRSARTVSLQSACASQQEGQCLAVRHAQKADAAREHAIVISALSFQDCCINVCNTVGFLGLSRKGWGSPPDVGVGEGLGGVGNLSQDLAGVAASEHGQLVHRPVPVVEDMPVRPLRRYFACRHSVVLSRAARSDSATICNPEPQPGPLVWEVTEKSVHAATLHQALAKVGAAHPKPQLAAHTRSLEGLLNA